MKEGNLELSGSYTANTATRDEDGTISNNNYGFRVGYGFTDKFDLKFRYERLNPSNNVGDFKGATYFSIIPKFAIIAEELSILIPVSYYTYKDVFIEEFRSNLTSVAPQIIYTFTSPKKKSDLSLGLKGDFLFGGGGGGVILGITVGAGFSSNLSKWAIRPEVGASFSGWGGSFLTYGIGLQLIIPTRKIE